MNSLIASELNVTIRSMGFPAPKAWKRVDCGQIETYVGDGLYVVALVEKYPENMEQMKELQFKTEGTVIKYLQNEGFIDKEYVYVGMQRFSLKHPPKDFLEGEDGTSA